MTLKSMAALLCGLAAFGCAGAARAQTYTPDDVLRVRQRAVDDTSPSGIRAGNFIIDPGIEVKETFDDNIYHMRNGEKSDIITNLRPAIAVQSDWERHALFFGAEGDFGRYGSHGGLNYNDYGVLASGRYDLDYDTYLTGALSQARRHEGRGSSGLSETGGDSQVAYTVTAEQLGFVRALSLVKLNVLGKNEHVSLLSDPADNPGVNVLAGESRDNRKLLATLSYEYVPGSDYFVSLQYDTTDYRLAGGGGRSSDGGDVRAGMHIDPGFPVKGSFYAGYLMRNYEGGGSDDTRDPYFGGTIGWSITPLTSVSFLMDKRFEETTVESAAGAVHTVHRLSAYHSFTTRLNADAVLGFDDNSYEGGVNRKAHVYYGGVDVDYALAPFWGVRLGYNRAKRTSTLDTDQYNDNRVMLSLIYMR